MSVYGTFYDYENEWGVIELADNSIGPAVRVTVDEDGRRCDIDLTPAEARDFVAALQDWIDKQRE